MWKVARRTRRRPRRPRRLRRRRRRCCRGAPCRTIDCDPPTNQRLLGLCSAGLIQIARGNDELKIDCPRCSRRRCRRGLIYARQDSTFKRAVHKMTFIYNQRADRRRWSRLDGATLSYNVHLYRPSSGLCESTPFGRGLRSLRADGDINLIDQNANLAILEPTLDRPFPSTPTKRIG